MVASLQQCSSCLCHFRLFLSTVSAEFLCYRERLYDLLTRPEVEVKVQEALTVACDEILEMPDRYIQRSET